jgi:hypothetical protein
MSFVKKSVFVFLCSVILPCGSSVFAELDNDFRSAFPELLKNLCYSTVDYDLDRSFEIVRSEYHHTQNCLFDDALYQTTKRISKEIETKTSGQGNEGLALAPQYSTLGNTCDKASEIRRLQEANGLRTRCGIFAPSEKNSYGTITQPYSACRVGEMALQEWCGYQKYLWAKIRDEETFFSEKERETMTYDDWKKKTDTLRKQYRYESRKSREGLLTMIDFYQEFEQNYRFHAWLMAIENKLKQSRTLWGKMRAIFALFPEKFINASTP